MRRETEGPNKLPGKSRLTLFLSNSGMSSLVVAWRAGREVLLRDDERRTAVAAGVLARVTPGANLAGAKVGARVIPGANLAGALDVVPVCVRDWRSAFLVARPLPTARVPCLVWYMVVCMVVLCV